MGSSFQASWLIMLCGKKGSHDDHDNRSNQNVTHFVSPREALSLHNHRTDYRPPM
jgi:hypothetical protein